MDTSKLLELPLMRGFSQPLRHAIADGSKLRTYPSNSVVFPQGAHPGAVVYTLNGMLFSWITNSENERILLTHFHPDRLLLVNNTLQHRPLDFELYAVTRVELLLIPSHVFMHLLEHFPEFQSFVINGLGRMLDDMRLALCTHKASSKEQGIAQFLVHCCSWSAIPQQQLPFSIEFISDCLRLSRPFVAKTIKHFARLGIMGSKYGKTIVLDLERLRLVADRGIGELAMAEDEAAAPEAEDGLGVSAPAHETRHDRPRLRPDA
ncbi:cyclic nucleotide-binding protein [Rubrivivax gelatinosus IL144]|uniref:Cyclic nucleotide-binding protein n=2 Tax=Rubrivivax gelatinosus TaxID=28068 RepID=I0HKE0_RUBGI|nr:cyclic nucleotide-binding protein [Rubrivivax gelatinosus IL144]